MRLVSAANFGGFEIQNVIAQAVAGNHSQTAAGTYWYDSTANWLKYYKNGSTVVTVRDDWVASVAAADSTVTVGGTSAAPTVKVATGGVTNTQVASGAAIALSKLATDPLARANHTGTQPAATISDFDTQVRTSRLDQMAAPTSAVGFNGQRATSVADPTADSDAATRGYVVALFNGTTNKGSVRVATTASLALTSATATSVTRSGNLPTAVDGVTLSAGDLVLVKNETGGTSTGAAANGLYVYAAGTTWVRAANADTNAEVKAGLFVFVSEGTANANRGYTLTTDDPVTVGTTQLTFDQTSGAGQVTAGAGLTKSGDTIDVVGTSARILANADSIDIDPAYAGQTSITTLGTVTTGTWSATAVALNKGGTGATTQAGAANAVLPTQTSNSGKFLTTDGSNASWGSPSGGVGSYKATVTGDGSTASFTISQSTHGRASDWSNSVAVYDPDSSPAGLQVYADVYVAPATGDVRIDFGSAPANAKTYKVVIQG